MKRKYKNFTSTNKNLGFITLFTAMILAVFLSIFSICLNMSISTKETTTSSFEMTCNEVEYKTYIDTVKRRIDNFLKDEFYNFIQISHEEILAREKNMGENKSTISKIDYDRESQKIYAFYHHINDKMKDFLYSLGDENYIIKSYNKLVDNDSKLVGYKVEIHHKEKNINPIELNINIYSTTTEPQKIKEIAHLSKEDLWESYKNLVAVR